MDGDGLKHDDVARIAEELNVPTREVLLMNQRLGGRDSSLNAPVTADIAIERQDLLVDERPNQEEMLGNREEEAYGNALLAEGFKLLDPREREILTERRLRENPLTLEELGTRFGVSRERVRQLENRAFAKLQAAVTAAAHA
jgi:RNA polymerase sigma-32 factor